MVESAIVGIPSVTDAAAPFNDVRADIILRSSDNVDFRCYKVLLSLSSTFFEGMFALPQPKGPGGDVMKDGLHVIPVEEKAAVLETILRLGHPSSIRDPPILELDAIKDILDTARKYSMEDAEHIVRIGLIREGHLAKEPLRVFAIASALRLEMETRVAAAATFLVDPNETEYFPEMEFITAGDIFRLHKYQYGRRTAALDPTHISKALKDKSYAWGTCRVTSTICPNISIPGIRDEGTKAKWWVDGYLAPCQKQLEKRPNGKTVKTSEILAAGFMAAQECHSCKTTCSADMAEFAGKWSEEIDAAVAKVLNVNLSSTRTNRTNQVELNLKWATPKETE